MNPLRIVAVFISVLAFFSCVSVDDTAEIFKISFDENDAAATGTMAQQEVTSGTTATLLKCTFAKTGWRFAGWAATAEGAVAYADQAAYKMGNGNVTLFAKWTINTNQVAFDKNDAAAMGSMSPQSIAYGATAALTANAFAKTGCSFAGWATNASGTVIYADKANYTMGTNGQTLFAKWTNNLYRVTFDKNDAAATGSMSQQVIAYQATANLTANGFAKSNWYFVGWATSASGEAIYGNQAALTMGSSDITLYAKWSQTQHTVSFDSMLGSAVASQLIAHSGFAVKPADPVKSGYSFSNWHVTSALQTIWNFSANTVTSNTTLYASWVENPALPVVSLSSGTYMTQQNITMSCATTGSYIKWSTNAGATWNSTPSSSYTFTLYESRTLQVKSARAGAIDSAVVSRTYTIPQVLVAGAVGNYAVYWNNTRRVNLTSGSYAAEARDIIVSGNDIYVCGYEVNASGKRVAKYWKNGVATSLSSGTYPALANRIIVSGGIVYAAGYANNGSLDVATLWVNGTAYSLSSTTVTADVNAASAYGLWVDGSNIYVSGFEGNNSVHNFSYWKNGVKHILGTKNGEAATVKMYGGSLYVSGNQHTETSSQRVAVFYKDGTRNTRTDGTKYAGIADIVVDNGTVYALGIERNMSDQIVLWKDGLRTDLTAGTYTSTAGRLAIFNGWTYACGHTYENGYSIAKYWVNGNPVVLANGYAWSINIRQ